MNQAVHNRLISFIWSIADDCLRDVYVRGKYRDVILPMVVLRRLDVLLEPTKEAVLEEVRYQREELELKEFYGDDLARTSGYVFYNTSKWTLRELYDTASNSQQLLLANFEEYLDGFSQNVKEIIDKFKLRSQIRHMASKDVLLNVLEKFTSKDINLTPFEREDGSGKKLPALSNLGMGYVFEELIRKFNEENNEEAGEHFTPREVIDLMTHVIFEPIKDKIPPVITIYDPACGSGGMLTEAQDFIKDEEGKIRASSGVDVYVYGKEINDETYAICKSDMMIKGNDPEHIRVGSTLASDEFGSMKFDFMLSNPPYGKSWKSDEKHIKDGKEVIDPRFKVRLADYWGNMEEAEAVPRSSDGQLLFLMEMVSKMKPATDKTLGSRIASVHNGSSLFTGDAGGGESNIRRYIIENDWLDCIVQLPNNLFYNTGITTYIWFLNNNKDAKRQNKVLLIDASQRFAKLRKNLGAKNCELTAEHIQEILKAYLDFNDVPRTSADSLAAKVFDNSDFGYYKIVVDRPARLMAQFSAARIQDLRFEKSLKEPMQWAFDTYGERVYTDLPALEKEILDWCEKNAVELNSKKRKELVAADTWLRQQRLLQAATDLLQQFGEQVFNNFNTFSEQVQAALKTRGFKFSSSELKEILNAVSWYDENAEKVLRKIEKISGEKLAKLLHYLGCRADQLPDFGYYPTGKKDEYATYESQSDLRDSENVPLNENVHDYFLREVKPHVDEAWIDLEKTKIGYEISFNKYFYQHTPLRSIEEVSAEILALDKESDGLIAEILS